MDWWIKIHRKILSWDRYSDSNTFRVFLHLLLIANHKEANRRWINIPRWWTTTSMETIAKDLKLTKKQIIVAIKHLKRTQEVSQEKVLNHWLITVKNYDSYQSEVTEKVSERSQGGHREVTKQEWKKEINKEIIKSEWFSEEINNLLQEYNKWRKKKLEKLTEKWLSMFYSKLKSLWWSDEWIKLVLEQSITNWWEWIFELKWTVKKKELTDIEIWTIRNNRLHPEWIRLIEEHKLKERYTEEQLRKFEKEYFMSYIK